MKRILLYLSSIIGLIAIGLLIGLYIKPNEIGRYQLQTMYSDFKSIPKVLTDTKTGDVWVLYFKDGFEWRQIRGNKVENKGWAF